MSATAAKKQKPLKRHPSKLKKMSAYAILAIILISIMAVLFAFYEAAFDAGMGRRRMQLATGLLTAYFGYGALSGVVEPLGALLTIALTSFITPALPYILSFAAGAMIYVVVEELIPESQAGEHSNVATVGVALGFALMMVLDIAFG